MKVLLFVASFLFVAHGFSILGNDMEEWKAYKMEYKKSYSEEEDKFRMKVFMDNKQKIEEHNARYKKGEVTFTTGLNQFSDMLDSEFLAKYTGFKGIPDSNGTGDFESTLGSTFIPPDNVNIPDEVDWTEKGAVTPIKNQGRCGSCWAFSVTGTVEGQHFLKTGKLVSLSEQQLVDCSRRYGNRGCSGGYMNSALQYIIDNKGINTEEAYPYTAKDGNCKFDPNDIGATISSYNAIQRGNETALQIAIATVGPVSVGIDAGHRSFQTYSGGVYSESECSPIKLNHGVLVVGYGTDKESGKKYWLVKNSWGETWGAKGYIKMERDARNMCGIATFANYPVV